MKKINKILVVVIISIFVLAFMPSNNCLAMTEFEEEVRTIKIADSVKPSTVTGGGGGSKITDAAGAIDGLKVTGSSSADVGGLQTVIGKLLNFLQIASGLVAVLMIAIVGFGYIVAQTSDMKAEFKNKGLPIIIGIVLVFGATSIAKFFIGVAA